METIITYLEKNRSFHIAETKSMRFKRLHMMSKDPVKNTYYLHTEDRPIEVVTALNGITETKNMVKRGDVVITGPYNERYVVSCAKFFSLYDVVDEVAIKKKQQRSVAHVPVTLFKQLGIPTKSNLSFKAPWGEDMTFLAGDYLVKEGPGMYYRIEKRAFERTYDWNG